MKPEPYEQRLPSFAHDEQLLRDALHRTADTLSPLPDLVPEAVREGHRRRARNRAAAVAGTFVAVTALTLGLSVLGPWLLSRPDTVPATPAGPSLSLPAPSPSPQQTEPRPDMTPPTSTPVPTHSADGPTTPPAATPSRSAPPPLTPEEAQRLEEFRRRAAGALDALLPSSIGTVRPVGEGAQDYQGRRGGVVHSVRLSVHPVAGSAAPACRDLPDKGLTCGKVILADGTPAQVFRQPAEGRTGTVVSLRYQVGRSTVALSVSPAPSGSSGTPLTTGDLIRVAESPRFRELVAYADADPVPRSGGAS
ncbi:hypothetical protein CIB93_06120 [Streptomyces sp. WZ.A104]|uniref:hypothetical protein n=1 Tax=Streptomyces sp. WZ.A104 TaxID=2023771 RepID=UPI000BBB8D8F|nr:hypothetical protein [Streptomyces sp. WZ.A104]PCG86797.1 hypothetical protein CIB93_06120 [Streptomyces sp. WZ.A104]